MMYISYDLLPKNNGITWNILSTAIKTGKIPGVNILGKIWCKEENNWIHEIGTGKQIIYVVEVEPGKLTFTERNTFIPRSNPVMEALAKHFNRHKNIFNRYKNIPSKKQTRSPKTTAHSSGFAGLYENIKRR